MKSNGSRFAVIHRVVDRSPEAGNINGMLTECYIPQAGKFC